MFFFPTFGANTSISKDGVELYRAPGAFRSAKMTRPLYDDGTCVRVDEFLEGVSLSSLLRSGVAGILKHFYGSGMIMVWPGLFRFFFLSFFL